MGAIALGGSNMKRMNFKQNMMRSKEVLAAYLRQGMRELGSVFYGSGTAAQHAEYGMLGTRTPGEVADGVRGIERTQMSSGHNDPGQQGLDAYIQEAEQQLESTPEPEIEPARDDMEIDRE